MQLFPETQDLVQPLLQAIRPHAPAGDSLRSEPEYAAIRQARSSDHGLPQGVWQRQEQRSEWATVETLCMDALQTRSKDLQIAIWLAEAWIYTRGAIGLLAGVELLSGLHEHFAYTMFPNGSTDAAPGEGAVLSEQVVEYRVNLIQNFDERIALALKFVPLAAPQKRGDSPPHTFADVEKARFDEQVRRRMQQEAPAAATFERIDTERASTPEDWLRELDRRLSHARAGLSYLDNLLDSIYGRENGGVGEIARVVDAMRTYLLPYLPTTPPAPFGLVEEMPTLTEGDEDTGTLHGAGPLLDGEETPESEGPPRREATPTVPIAPSRTKPASHEKTPIRSRQEAFAQLQEVTDYLAQTEPHSPVPFLLRRAIHWGSLSLTELLPELVKYKEVLDESYRLERTR